MDRMSSPWKMTSPSRLAPSGSSPMRPRPRVDFPHPDSPTRPSVSPGARSKLTPSTARTAPRVVPYQTRTSRAEITGSMSGSMSGRMSGLLVGVGADDGSGRHHDRQQSPPAQGRVERLVEPLTAQG